MPNKTASDILSAIYDTLTASPSLVPDTLKEVRLGIDGDHSSGFPYCRVFLLDLASEAVDTVSYQRSYTFAVEIWQDYSQANKETAELNFCNAIDTVLNRLDGEWQLGIGVELTTVQQTTVGVTAGPGAPMRVATIRFVVTNLVQNPA